MPNLGVPELIIIMVIVLLVFGAGKLPDIGRALGKSISEFKKAKEEDEQDRTLKVMATREEKRKTA